MADADANVAAQSVQSGTGGQPATGSGAPSGNAGANGAPWHANIDPSIRDFWSGKKYDISDPAKLVDVVTRNYMNTAQFVGVPAEELLRIPKPNADTADINTFWNRVGVPKEAKDYDFSQVKMSDGSDVDPAFFDTMRASLHANRVTKDQAPNVIKDVIKYLESNDKAEQAELSAEVQKQTKWLNDNWGPRAAYNSTVAKDALERIGQAAGLTQEQINQGWDALSKVGGIGAAYGMEMLRIIGSRMGEDPAGLVSGGLRPGQEQLGAMSKQDAAAQIAELKRDQGFVERLLRGDQAAKRQWENLHVTMVGTHTTAA